MSQSIEALTKSLLHAARQAGADSADAMAVRGTSVNVDVRGGVLEQAERAEGVDIGLRVFVGRRSANVSASDTSDRTIEEMAIRAVAMAKEAPEDPYIGLADPDQLATDWDVETLELYDPAPEPSPEALQDDAARAEAAGLAVKGVSQVQSAGAGYGAQQVFMAASNGFEGGYRRTDRGLSCVAIAGTGTGMERDYDGDSRIFQTALRSPEDIGTKAGDVTKDQAGKTVLEHRIIAETPFFQSTGLEVVDQDVGAFEQAQDHVAPLGLADVDGDGALVAVGAGKIGGKPVVEGRAPAARLVPLRRLDLDDLGAMVGQRLGAIGAAQHAAEVKDADSVKRAGHHNTSR